MTWDKILNNLIISKRLRKFNKDRDKLTKKRLDEMKKEQKIVSNFEMFYINTIIKWSGKRKLTKQEQGYLFKYLIDHIS